MAGPIPTHVIAGPLGCGKTTVIASLLAAKPAAENWVVLLNEYSEAGIDALTVASAARGAYDVQLIPGGCLCCAGEDDFRRKLRDLVDRVRPARILVEPSGVGHPAGMVEELLAHEAAGELRLEGVVSLVDPQRLAIAASDCPDLLRAQLEIGDALALTKADLATAEERARFRALAATLAPAKRWIGECRAGALPFAALTAGLGAERPMRADPAAAVDTAAHPDHDRSAHARHGHGADDPAPAVPVGSGERMRLDLVGQQGASWRFPRACGFDEDRVIGLARGPFGAAARFKAVLRVAEDRWLLVQHAGHGLDLRECSWRRDSRAEVIFDRDRSVDWNALDAAWLAARSTGA